MHSVRIESVFAVLSVSSCLVALFVCLLACVSVAAVPNHIPAQRISLIVLQVLCLPSQYDCAIVLAHSLGSNAILLISGAFLISDRTAFMCVSAARLFDSLCIVIILLLNFLMLCALF